MEHPSFVQDFIGSFLDFYGGGLLGAAVLAAFAALLLVGCWKRFAPEHSPEGRLIGALFTLGLLSILIPFAVSQYFPIFVTGRYTIIALPPFAVGLGCLLRRQTPPALVAGALCVLLVGSAAGLVLRRHAEEPTSDRKTSVMLGQKLHAGDIVVYNGLTQQAIEYYFLLKGLASDVDRVTFPAELNEHRVWMDVRGEHARLPELTVEARQLAASLKNKLAAGQRLWVFQGGDDEDVTDLLLRTLDGELTLDRVETIQGPSYNRVLVYRR